MQDYPEDGGKGMSQVFHGGKMLTNALSLGPPAVCVDGTVYFVNEILQEPSGNYSIPERFFLAMQSIAGQSDAGNTEAKEIFALGRGAVRTKV
jgi:hypothetical protein